MKDKANFIGAPFSYQVVVGSSGVQTVQAQHDVNELKDACPLIEETQRRRGEVVGMIIAAIGKRIGSMIDAKDQRSVAKYKEVLANINELEEMQRLIRDSGNRIYGKEGGAERLQVSTSKVHLRMKKLGINSRILRQEQDLVPLLLQHAKVPWITLLLKTLELSEKKSSSVEGK